MKLRYLPSAKQDIAAIIAYIADDLDDVDAAERTIAAVLRKAKRLERFPNSGKKLEDVSDKYADFRMLVAGNYTVVYFIGETSVDVVRVVHVSLDYTRLI